MKNCVVSKNKLFAIEKIAYNISIKNSALLEKLFFTEER